MTAHRADAPPWEIGRPQPAFLALAEAGAIRGRVLDVGCGTGEHVLMTTGLGLEVTGIDVNDAALRVAERKATDHGLRARFRRLDARRLAAHAAELGEPFDTVLDCELFHALVGADRADYLAGLAAVLRPGGRYYTLCYSDAQPDVPHRVSRNQIRAAFRDGWRIDAIAPVIVETNVHRDGARGWLATMTRTRSQP